MFGNVKHIILPIYLRHFLKLNKVRLNWKLRYIIYEGIICLSIFLSRGV